MTEKDPSECLEDIVKYARQAMDFGKNVSRAEFESNLEKQYALIRCLEVIGEAAVRLDKIAPSIRQGNLDIPWKKIIGMRNMLIHHYEEANLGMIWDTVQNHVPELEKQIANILEDHRLKRKKNL